METNHSDKVLAFDTLFTDNHIQILKVLLPFMSQNVQKQLAVCIKLLELRYTLNFFQENPLAHLLIFEELPESERPVPYTLFDEILPFCSPFEKEKLQNILDLYRNMENMQEMMQILQLLQEIAPESENKDADLSEMMEMLQGMFSPPSDAAQ